MKTIEYNSLNPLELMKRYFDNNNVVLNYSLTYMFNDKQYKLIDISKMPVNEQTIKDIDIFHKYQTGYTLYKVIEVPEKISKGINVLTNKLNDIDKTINDLNEMKNKTKDLLTDMLKGIQ